MDRPPIRDGAVAMVGQRIVAVGSATELRRQFPEGALINYHAAALLPGLINAHTHLELTNRPRIDFDGDIAGWLLRQRPPADLTIMQHQADVESATSAGIAQCLRFGVTCVGDISQQSQWTRPIVAASPLRGISFGEVLGIGRLRERTTSMIDRALDPKWASPRLRVGISPHAPYTVDSTTLTACSTQAAAAGAPLCIHLAEFREEAEFLLHGRGVFRDLWERAGLWERNASDHFEAVWPITLTEIFDLRRRGYLLAHVNHARDVDISVLADGQASVVYCPRTHAYFRHPPHRWRDMLAAGVNVAIGTDSAASSPDLNIVDDLRLLRTQDSTLSVELLWSLITSRAAKAMNMENKIGSLTPGKLADISVFESTSDNPLTEILDLTNRCIDLWIDGKRISVRP